MSNELLRIHDENNNCDLVAVTNPMGNTSYYGVGLYWQADGRLTDE